MRPKILDQISPYPWRGGTHGVGMSLVDANERRIASMRYADGVISRHVTADQALANHRAVQQTPALIEFVSKIADMEAFELDDTQIIHDARRLLENLR